MQEEKNKNFVIEEKDRIIQNLLDMIVEKDEIIRSLESQIEARDSAIELIKKSSEDYLAKYVC